MPITALADSELTETSTMCFLQQKTRMELPYNPEKSSLIFLVLFLFLRTCLYFFPCLRINLNLPYFL